MTYKKLLRLIQPAFGYHTSRVPLFRWSALLLGLVWLVGSWSLNGAHAQAITTEWLLFNPVAVTSTRTDPVGFRVKIDGNPSSVQLQLAAGGAVNLTKGRNDVWEVTLPAAQALFDYQLDDANHNFVGFLDIFQGANRVERRNLFINVLDGQMPSMDLMSLSPQVRVSRYVVNIWRPDLAPTSPNLAAFDGQIRTVLRQFYQLYGDNFDFINLVLALPSLPANRYHFGSKNEVQGIGVPLFNNTALYGSRARLQGVNVFPIDTFFDLAEPGALHETGHQWINFLHVPVLAAGTPHWPISSLARGIMGLSIAGSNVGGAFNYNLVPLPNGNYRLESAPSLNEFTDLDLYLMGLLPSSDVGPAIVFPNQNQQVCHGCVLTGGTMLNIRDVIATEGRRVPDAANAQKQFRLATVVVTRERPLNDEEMALFSYFAARGETTTPMPYSSGLLKGTTKPFSVATRGLGSLITALKP